MNKASRALLRLFAVPACLAVPAACVDTSPIDYHAPPTKDAGAADAPMINSDAARVAECRACVAVDSCKADYDRCAADMRCEIWIDCLLDSFCVNIPSDLSKIPPCLTTCAVKAQIFSSDDPAVKLFRPVIFCSEDKCVQPCDIPTL